MGPQVTRTPPGTTAPGSRRVAGVRGRRPWRWAAPPAAAAVHHALEVSATGVRPCTGRAIRTAGRLLGVTARPVCGRLLGPVVHLCAPRAAQRWSSRRARVGEGCTGPAGYGLVVAGVRGRRPWPWAPAPAARGVRDGRATAATATCPRVGARPAVLAGSMPARAAHRPGGGGRGARLRCAAGHRGWSGGGVEVGGGGNGVGDGVRGAQHVGGGRADEVGVGV